MDFIEGASHLQDVAWLTHPEAFHLKQDRHDLQMGPGQQLWWPRMPFFLEPELADACGKICISPEGMPR
jgi:hypothetical protein